MLNVESSTGIVFKMKQKIEKTEDDFSDKLKHLLKLK